MQNDLKGNKDILVMALGYIDRLSKDYNLHITHRSIAAEFQKVREGTLTDISSKVKLSRNRDRYFKGFLHILDDLCHKAEARKDLRLVLDIKDCMYNILMASNGMRTLEEQDRDNFVIIDGNRISLRNIYYGKKV